MYTMSNMYYELNIILKGNILGTGQRWQEERRREVEEVDSQKQPT